MQSNQIKIDELEVERSSLARASKLHWFHWTVAILSLLVTIGAWYFAKTQVEERQAAKFNREADQVVQLIAERMSQYEDALWGGVAAIQSAGGEMNHQQWRTFSESLSINLRYPGINGIGVIYQVLPEDLEEFLAKHQAEREDFKIHPEHSNPVKMPITYIEPEAINAKAVGLDMAHETNRHTAALSARDSGNAHITGPIILVQDAGKTPGFLFYAPYYVGEKPVAASERLEHFRGMVYAPFVVNKLMEGTLRKELRQVGVRISDNGAVLYDELVTSEKDFDPNPLHLSQQDIQLYGRTWTFDIWSTFSFREATQSSQPLMILVGGIVLDCFLLTYFILLCRSNKNALNFTDRMTRELIIKADALAESNAELETFAYVTSHDLKTPLRGIGDLTEYIEEDLEDYLSGADANPDVPHNLKRLRTQVERMNNLIKGILDYSSLTSEPDTVELILVRKYLSSLRNELGLREDQLEIDSSCPNAFPTHATRLMQVFSNLIGNAYKYHHDQEHAKISVSVRSVGPYYRFFIADNGPGIDPKFHARIFEVFQSLQSKDEIESNGVGLSIVKKIVESYRGRVYVDSVLGEGTVFSFDWPKEMVSAEEPTARAG